MKANANRRDTGGKLKNGVFKEHYKDGSLACVGNTATAKKSVYASIICGTDSCGP